MNTFCRRLFTVCVFLCALRGYAAIPSARAGSPKYIRVLIMQGLPSLGLKVSGAYQIQDAKSRQVLYRGRDIKATVTQAKGRIWLGPKGCDTDRLLLSASDNNVILNGRRFRGDALIIKEKDNTFSVVNYIGLEDYVKGVLYHEVSHYWPQEALKAQAVASRTFAFYQAQENAAKDFDVTCDFYSQMYGGRAAERYRTSFAVEVTKGEILVYEGKVFPAYFHATCAGHTEDASLLWDTDLPVLKGVVCNFCKDSPHFKWHYVVSLKGLQEALKKSGYVFTQITSITVLGRDMSGRVTNVRISDQLHSADVAAKDLRSVIGPKLLRSTNFKIGISGDDAVFEGFGWGHGVGLCQWGAYFMAKEGYTYQEILQFYYPGSTRTLAEENQ
ncbi:MAG: SpoIID/LytB domain-containing protein [Candidatus Omnitrophica bacterium]|nr:SpoIID/LytB domain-containing protein [Candidatus Omnitrophota bacterium]